MDERILFLKIGKKIKEIRESQNMTQEELSIGSEEKSPFINKRTWITDSILSPQNDYTLSTPKGSAFRISQEDLLTLCKRIENFLNFKV